MIKVYNAEEFRNEFAELIEANEPKFQLLLGDLERSLANGNQANDFFAAIYKDKELKYLLCNYDVFNLLTYAMSNEDYVEEAAIELAKFVKENGYTLHGIQGSEEFTKAYNEEAHTNYTLHLAMDIMICTKLEPVSIHGELVKGSKEYFEDMCGMYQAFIAEALHEELEMELIKGRVSNILENHKSWVYKVNGEIVGMVISTREGKSCVSFSGVYTKPVHRGKGYCKEFMYLVGQEMMQYKPKLTLFVDKSNPRSNAAYKAIGYVCDCSVFAYE